MRSSCAINLLITGVCFLEFYASSDICSGNHYTVTDADGKFIKCQSCGACHEGFGLEPKCGSTVQSPVVNVSCEPCSTGTFSNKYDSGPCYKCQVCDEHQFVLSYCNSQADTNCSQTCENGFYFARDVSQSCHKCSYCCDDGKDDEQPDCVKQGLKKINQHCSHRVDKDCAPDRSTDISSPSINHGKKQLDLGKILAITFGALLGVAVVILVVCAVWKRRQSRDQGQITAPIAHDQETALIEVIADTSQEKNGNISQESALHSPTIGSTPLPLAVSKLIQLNKGFTPSNPGTRNVTPDHTDDELDPEPDHSNRPRKLTRPKKYNSQTSKEAIKIKEEPSSQKIKEGVKVELVFKCKARGNSKLTYQWYKDGAELQGKDEGTLVLKSVTLPDFGCYKCVARVKDSPSNSVESLPAELDVTPRDGTRYKCLKSVDIDTQDLIAGLLTQTSSIVPGWRKIAIKYEMDNSSIKYLENDPEAGKKTLEYLGATKPDLTAYDFCKTLKDIRRLDIVKELLGHLSVPSSSKVYV